MSEKIKLFILFPLFYNCIFFQTSVEHTIYNYSILNYPHSLFTLNYRTANFSYITTSTKLEMDANLSSFKTDIEKKYIKQYEVMGDLGAILMISGICISPIGIIPIAFEAGTGEGIEDYKIIINGLNCISIATSAIISGIFLRKTGKEMEKKYYKYKNELEK